MYPSKAKHSDWALSSVMIFEVQIGFKPSPQTFDHG